MAEFSKQYCEAHLPEWPWDFDLNEEFQKLEPGEYMPLICEGYGFCGIGIRPDTQEHLVFFYNFKSNEYETVPYDSLLSDEAESQTN